MTAIIQGMYYIVTGLWPAFNVSSFEKVTGPKTDKWLVKVMGFTLAGIGVVLLIAEPDTARLLGIIIAAILGFADLYYALRGVISKIYLGDAVIQALIIAGWVLWV
jgi:hypothetical protein